MHFCFADQQCHNAMSYILPANVWLPVISNMSQVLVQISARQQQICGLVPLSLLVLAVLPPASLAKLGQHAQAWRASSTTRASPTAAQRSGLLRGSCALPSWHAKTLLQARSLCMTTGLSGTVASVSSKAGGASVPWLSGCNNTLAYPCIAVCSGQDVRDLFCQWLDDCMVLSSSRLFEISQKLVVHQCTLQGLGKYMRMAISGRCKRGWLFVSMNLLDS